MRFLPVLTFTQQQVSFEAVSLSKNLKTTTLSTLRIFGHAHGTGDTYQDIKGVDSSVCVPMCFVVLHSGKTHLFP
jgi:hypothetical protein